ncbi:MAG TPA: DNA topoisomerase IV subunit A [Spirochaetaceae bacterium]|nr:DNA topoisomerase IV subunit A [Spirochaetaceae bacterium]
MQNLEELFKKYYLEYTSYVVKDRAIPYIEDGFKPVQRRIIQTLIDSDNGSMYKVSDITGRTMRYHPHGDSSIYEALVNLVNAGYFIEGNGNFGNMLTGTEAAAARYIECRLYSFAKEVLYSPDITEYVPSYDGKYKEPVVFPSKLPAVLLQGVMGIAPGMTCKIFPHNPLEVIECMKTAIDGGDFQIFPDLPTGGLIDVSCYDDGKGEISIRSKVDVDEKNRKLVVREIPYGVTTESLIADIDSATKKGKLHAVSINDYTTKTANIEIEIAKGDWSLDKELESLFAHTKAEMKVKDLSPMLIVNKHPVIMGISEIIRFHAAYLQDVLRRELEFDHGKLIDKMQMRTLERIFIEERIYKRIETLRTQEEIDAQVREGLMAFKDEFVRELVDEDIENLLKLPIRRISLFDIEKNRKDVEELNKTIKENEDKQRHIKRYAKSVLDRLAKLIPKSINTARKSEIASFSVISVKDLAEENLQLKYDRSSGYIGYALKTGDDLFMVGESSKILIVLKDGTYHVTQAQDKYFAGKNVAFVLPADKDLLRKTIFTILFRSKSTKVMMIKRCCITQFIMNRMYSLVPDGDFEAKFICKDEEGRLTIEFKTGRIKTEQVWLSDFLVKGVSSQGVQLTRREVEKIGYRKMNAEDKPPATAEPDLFSNG